MRINEILLDSIQQSIFEFNDKYEDKRIDNFSDDDLAKGVPEETLSKLEVLKISLKTKNVGEDEIQEITKQLSQLLDVMNLKEFRFSVSAKDPYPLDVSFLEHLNDDITHISITGVDLSNEESSRFEKFKNLNRLALEKCNISDPKIISKIKLEKAFVSLEGNEIAPEYYEDALRLIQSSKRRINFSDKELQTISKIYSTKQVKLSDYVRLMDVINFDDISELKITIENEFDFDNINSEQIVNSLNEKTNITLESTLVNLLKLDGDGTLKVPTRAIIKNASELSVEELKKHQCIATVQISDGENTKFLQEEPYLRTEYEKVRGEIDLIISQVDLPDEGDPNREKKIFTQIYKILGKKIDYDNKAISKEEKSNKKLEITSRNLLGGLLENKCVCAGYADILRNVLACAGIYSEYVDSPENPSGDKERFIVKTNDPHGHAWNLVKLDGKKYWTDLTWDADNIKTDRYPLSYCLKSTKDFKHYPIYKKRLQDKIEDPCLESIPDEEQYKLFKGENLNISEEQKKEDKNIGYLSSGVGNFASSLTSANLREVAKVFTMLQKDVKEKDVGKELPDGRD